MMESTRSLLVLNTGFTIGVDGPGQRMVVYLKGCNMYCPWCGAPESMNQRPEVLFYPDRLECPSRAALACPHNAIDGDGRNREICCDCAGLDCILTDNPAFDLAGREISVNSLVESALRYRRFYARSGGVTIGGGEPTCQWDGLQELLLRLKNEGIHTALETNGTSDRLPELFDLIDVLLIDFKHPDSRRCAEVAGQGNENVIANIAARHRRGSGMVVRICLVPGFNSGESELRAFGSILGEIGSLKVELIPMHRRGEAKWRALGLELEERRVPTEQDLALAQSVLREYGLQVSIAA